MKKKLLFVMLAAFMSVAFWGCGEEEVSTNETKTTESVADSGKEESTETTEAVQGMKRTSEELYQDFLAGNEKVYVDQLDYTTYDYEIDDYVPYFTGTEGMTLTGMLQDVIAVEAEFSEMFLASLDYSLIDCGMDGEPELAIYAIFSTDYYEQYEKQFIVRNVDGKLQLCHVLDGSEGFYNCLENVNGLVSTSGYYGYGSYTHGEGFFDGDGKYHFVYDAEDSYYGVYALDERFEEYINDEDMEDIESYLTIYDFLQYEDDNWNELLEARVYCAELDDEDYYDVTSEENVAVFQPIFDSAGIKLYTRKELNEVLAKKEQAAGLTDEIKDGEYIEWMSCEIDFDEVNGIETVSVSSVEELMAAIGPRKKVFLAPGEYNVTKWLLSEIGKGNIWDYYSYDAETDEIETSGYYGEFQSFFVGTEEEPGLALFSLSHCTLASSDPSNPATIVSDPRGEDVVDFYSCNSIVLENLVFGHTDGNDECAGDVLYFGDCEKIDLNSCDLYGCGATGIDLVNTYQFTMNDSVIHDCSVGGAYLSDSYGINFNNTTFENIDGYGVISMSSGTADFTECAFYGYGSQIISDWFDGYVYFNNCDFDDVLREGVENNELYGEQIFIYEY